MYKKICVIGEGITSLIVTRVLLDLNLEIDLVSESFFSNKKYDNRSLAISYSNFKYFSCSFVEFVMFAPNPCFFEKSCF